VADSPPTPADPIITEAMRVEIDSNYSARANFIGAGVSERAHTWLGIPATGLAALAASVAVGLPDALAAAAALIAAVLTAVQTFGRSARVVGEFHRGSSIVMPAQHR
jgi:hypothetical protein